MYSTLITAVALFAAPALAAFAINEPELKQCQSSKISWSPSNGPYNLIAVSAADPCGEPLAEIGDFTATYTEWKVTLPAGTVVQLSVADKDDNEAWSGNITVGASSDSSCLTSAPGATSSSTTSSTTTSDNTSSSNTTPAGGDTTTTDDDGGVIPVGAANAGTNKILGGSNAAPAARSLSTPVMALSAIAALAALAL